MSGSHLLTADSARQLIARTLNGRIRTTCERTSRRPMRAIVCTDYGPPDVLSAQRRAEARSKDNEVLVRNPRHDGQRGRLRAAAVRFASGSGCPFGCCSASSGHANRARAGACRGRRVVGKDVTSFKKGDRVFANDGYRAGAYAEVHLPAREPPDRHYRDDAGEPEL